MRRANHPLHAEQIVASTKLAYFRRLRGVERIDLAKADFEVQPIGICSPADCSQVIWVQMRIEVQDRAEEHAVETELADAIQDGLRPEPSGVGELSTADTKPHVRAASELAQRVRLSPRHDPQPPGPRPPRSLCRLGTGGAARTSRERQSSPDRRPPGRRPRQPGPGLYPLTRGAGQARSSTCAPRLRD